MARNKHYTVILLLTVGLIVWHPREDSRATPPGLYPIKDSPVGKILDPKLIDSLDRFGDSVRQGLATLNESNKRNSEKQDIIQHKVNQIKIQLNQMRFDSTISDITLSGDTLYIIHKVQPAPKKPGLLKRIKNLF